MATYNDAYENVNAGNVALYDNTRFNFTQINELNWQQGEYNITLSHGVAELDLRDLTKKGYIRFNDGSYIECELTDISTLHKVFYRKNVDGTFTALDYGYTGIATTKTTIEEPGGPILYSEVITYGYSIAVYNEPAFSGIIQEFGCPLTSGARSTGNVIWTFASEEGRPSYNTIRDSFMYQIQRSDDDLIDFLAGDDSEPTSYPGITSDTAGGDGTFQLVNAEIPFSGFPNIQAIDLGFNTIYHPSDADVRAISRWLWSDDFTDNIKMNFISPFENILSLSFLPIPSNLIEEELSNFIVGNTRSNIQTYKVTNEYVTVDCGILDVNEYWGNFLDYDSSIMIWLPFIGYRSLKPDDMLNGNLHVRYKIDLLTGVSVCEIGAEKAYPELHIESVFHVLYSYPCNVYYNIAISGANYMSMYNQQLNASVSGINNVVGSIGKIASGNIIDGVTSLLTGQALAKREYDTAKPEYGRGGNSGGNSGIYSIMTPYLIRSVPIGRAPRDYNELQGSPSEITYTLSELTGYTEIEKVITDTLIHCTAEEKTSILSMLSSGVYL